MNPRHLLVLDRLNCLIFLCRFVRSSPNAWAARDTFPYYSAEALAGAMKIYNTELIDVCNDLAVECIDLAESIPRETVYFYDDAHFTESGAQAVATVIADYMLSNSSSHH